MKVKFLLFAIVLFGSQITITATAQAINVGDSLALVDFYNSTGGPNWYSFARHNWLTTRPVKTWNGVLVTGTRVTGLGLPEDNLIGTLPSTIGNLTALSSIGLNDNKLSGDIPASFFNLTRLTAINFENNQLTGNITLIGNLTKLVSVDMNHNKLSDTIPAAIGKLTSLQYLQFYDNQLTGSIPSTIGNLSSLLYFQLPKNQLTGSLPSSIGNLTNLSTIIIDNNQISGNLPASIGNLVNLTELSFSANRFSGELPLLSFGKLTRLTYFGASNNQLTISNNITNQYQGKGKPIEMYLYNNQFTFNGLEFIATAFPMASYSPQAPVAIHTLGNKLSVSAGGTLANNTYKWFITGQTGSTTITGDSTFQPAQSGSYYAQVTNSVATGLALTTDTVSFTAPFAKQTPLVLSVYPNPVTSELIVKGLHADANYRISVSDLSGHVWLSATTSNQSTANYDVNKLRPGNYVLTVTDGNTRTTLQFIKQ